MNSIGNGSVPPSYVAAILVRQKWQILIVFVLVIGGTAVATFLMSKQYETRMKILVKNERADVIVSADRNSESDFRGEVSETQINSEIELLNSNDLLKEVVTKVGLAQRELSNGSASVASSPVAMDKAMARLQQNLKISPVRKANIIQVEYTDRDPHMAVTVLQQLAESYLEMHLRVHGTPGTYQFFADQASRFGTSLEEAESKLAEFRQRENVVAIDQQKEMMLQQISGSESAVKQAEAAASEYTNRIAEIQKRLGDSQPRVITQSRVVPNQYSVERLNTMLAELQNQRTQLLAKFLPGDRLIEQVDQEIADTQAALAAAAKMTGLEQATDVNPVHQALQLEMAKAQSELAGIEARRSTLRGQAKSYRDQLAKLGNATTEYDDLVRNRKDAEDNYLLYTKKTEEARIAESLDQQKIANVVIAERPVEPHLPTKPNVPLNLAVGMCLAGFLSIGSAVGAEYFRETVTFPSELESLTGLPVLAVPLRRLAAQPASIPAETVGNPRT
jgi:uncharacterized protein involved in exopolysaccharide biosynthesis